MDFNEEDKSTSYWESHPKNTLSPNEIFYERIETSTSEEPP